MNKADELEKQLDEFRDSAKKEFDLKDLEKWMINELGVERKKQKGGSAVIYYHKALLSYNDAGHFTVHLIHDKKREQIRRSDLRKYMYTPLRRIIEFIRAEKQDAKE